MPIVTMAGRGSRLYTSGGGGGSFTPDVIKTFQGTNGVALDPGGGNPGGTVTLGSDGGIYSSYFSGYGTYYSNAQSRGGRTTSIAMRVAAGSTGDPTDGGTGGLFGISWGLPSAMYCVDGETLHYGMWMYFPSSWDFSTSSGYLKHLRIAVTGTGQKLDNLIAGGSTHYGWGFSNEFDQSQFAGSIRDVTVVIPKGQWCFIEEQFKFSSVGASAQRKIWIDGNFSMEINGANVRYIDTTTKTATLGAAIATLPNSGSAHHDGALFTYLNGGASQAQEAYLDALVIHKNIASLPATDAFGNKLIGLTAAGNL